MLTLYSRVPNKHLPPLNKFSKFFQPPRSYSNPPPPRLLIFRKVSWDNNKKVILKCNCSFNFEYATLITTFECSHFTFFPTTPLIPTPPLNYFKYFSNHPAYSNPPPPLIRYSRVQSGHFVKADTSSRNEWCPLYRDFTVFV